MTLWQRPNTLVTIRPDANVYRVECYPTWEAAQAAAAEALPFPVQRFVATDDLDRMLAEIEARQPGAEQVDCLVTLH